MERIILHCDCNAFYASVECVGHPELVGVPMAVCGDPESRHGIILAKNELAKGYGVQTAETLWQARRKCPELVLVPPRHDLYRQYSRRINDIYQQYTDLVEPFGIDESFLDVTGSLHLFGGDGEALAGEIRRRVREEIGVTISVGVSFCKVFAKLGSDLKKPDATTIITRENFKQVVWPLPASALLFVGKRTRESLERVYIQTIGDLAKADRGMLSARLGKAGETLHSYANGWDSDPVRPAAEAREVQSVGNSATFRRSLVGLEDIRTGIGALADNVAHRLREAGLRCDTVQVTIKDDNLKVISRQKRLDGPTCLSREIAEAAVELVQASWNLQVPIRLLSVTGLKLTAETEFQGQMSLFEDKSHRKLRQRQEKLDQAVHSIRGKFGGESITAGSVLGNDLGIGPAPAPDEDDGIG